MIRRQLLFFIAIGSLTVLFDFLIYRGILWAGVMELDVAKAMGFVSGSVFAYFMNRVFTFGEMEYTPGSALRFIILYGVTLAANVILNSVILVLLGKAEWVMQLAFFMATGVSAVLNFIGMKWFVFTRKKVVEFL